MGGHDEPPGQAVAPSNPLGDLIQAAINREDLRLHTWCKKCEIPYGTAYRILHKPGAAILQHTKERLASVLEVDVDTIENWTQSRAQLHAKGMKQAATKTERYGREFWHDMGVKGAAGYQARYSLEERREFSKAGGQATAEKTRGKKRDPDVARRATLGWLGPSGRGRTKVKEAHAKKIQAAITPDSRTRQSANIKTALARRDPDVKRATDILRGQKRKKDLARYHPRIRELHAAGRARRSIAQEIGVAPQTIERVMEDLGLCSRSGQWMAPEDVAWARRILRPDADAARARGRETQQRAADKKIEAAYAALQAEGKEITVTALRKRSGCRRDAILRWLKEPMASSKGSTL